MYNLTIQKRKVRRDIIRHPGVAAILAFDEDDKVILDRQHRFPRLLALFQNLKPCGLKKLIRKKNLYYLTA